MAFERLYDKRSLFVVGVLSKMLEAETRFGLGLAHA